MKTTPLNRLAYRVVLGAIAILSSVFPAKAGLIFTLDSPVYFGGAGTLVDITGFLSNPDVDPIFLNTASGSLSSADLDFDFTNYFVLVPRTLNSGDSFSGPIFSVSVSPSALPGDYFGSFTIQGGVDSSAFDDLATQNFQFTVPGASTVPEPSSFVLLGSSIAGILVSSRRCRQRT